MHQYRSSQGAALLTVVVDDFLNIAQILSIPTLGDVGLMVYRLASGLKDCCGLGLQNKGDG